MKLDTGVFTISLDFEMIWGTVDLYGPEPFRRACEIERAEVIERLLALFTEFDVSATWCTLGHLFLKNCQPVDGVKHPEIVRPQHAWQRDDWFADDPCGERAGSEIFYGQDLLAKIRACAVPQEIGSHTFSHVILGDAGCSRATAESEMRECVRLATEQGIELRSFAFPRNEVGHLDVLQEAGFWCYRGPEPHWYENPAVPAQLRRLLRLKDILTAAQPPVVLPELTPEGLWNLPGSALYYPMHGLRRHLPLWLRTRRAIKGLDAAALTKRIFHLWFHPTNLADESERMFAGLRQILEYAARLRSKGKLQILPMQSLVQHDNSASLEFSVNV